MRTNRIILSLYVLLTGALWTNAQESTHWQCDIYGYQYDMTVNFRLQQGDEAITDLSDFEVAAFVGGECRGISKIYTATASDNSDVQYGYLRVRSNETEGESVTFKVYQSSTSKTFLVEETLSFKHLDTIGLPSAPYTLTLSDALKGDANNDGSVDAADIVEVVNDIMGRTSSIFNKAAADMNDDGSVDAADIVLIVSIIMTGD